MTDEIKPNVCVIYEEDHKQKADLIQEIFGVTHTTKIDGYGREYYEFMNNAMWLEVRPTMKGPCH